MYNDGCLVMSLSVYVCDDGLSGILCGSSCVVVLSGKKLCGCEHVSCEGRLSPCGHGIWFVYSLQLYFGVCV